MSVITGNFTASGQASSALAVKKGDRFSFRISVGGGGINALIQFSPNGHTWTNYQLGLYDNTFLDAEGDFSPRYFTAEEGGLYRLRCPVHIGGNFAYELKDEPRTLFGPIQNSSGKVVFEITEAGVTGLEAGSTYGPGGATAVVGFGYGLTTGEGMVDKIVDEVITLPTDATFVDITQLLPVGCLPLSVAMFVVEPVTDGGTRVKLSIGVSGGDLDKYGVIDDPTLGTTVESLYANGSTVLAGTEQIAVSGTDAAGTALGDTDFTDGVVRVQVVYRELLALTEAIVAFP